MILVTFRQLRPLHWSKNILVFVPALLNWDFSRFDEISLLFVGLCLIASGGYQINDLMDLREDKTHPTKKFRPYAAGQISRNGLLYILSGLLGLAMLVSALCAPLRMPFMFYGLATISYTFIIKKVLVLDIFWLASLMTSRLFMGGVLAGISVTFYLSGFSFFLFLFLVLQKRISQIIRANRDRDVFSLYEQNHHRVLKKFAFGSALLSILSLLFYIFSSQGHRTFSEPLWLLVFMAGLAYWMYDLCRPRSEGPIDDAISYLFLEKRAHFFLALSLASFLMAKF